MKYMSEEREYKETWKSEFYNYDHEKGKITNSYKLSEEGAQLWDRFSNRFSFGFSIKVYLFSGFEF